MSTVGPTDHCTDATTAVTADSGAIRCTVRSAIFESIVVAQFKAVDDSLDSSRVTSVALPGIVTILIANGTSGRRPVKLSHFASIGGANADTTERAKSLSHVQPNCASFAYTQSLPYPPANCPSI